MKITEFWLVKKYKKNLKIIKYKKAIKEKKSIENLMKQEDLFLPKIL